MLKQTPLFEFVVEIFGRAMITMLFQLVQPLFVFVYVEICLSFQRCALFIILKLFAVPIDVAAKKKTQCQRQIKQGAMLLNSEITYIIGASFVVDVVVVVEFTISCGSQYRIINVSSAN